MMYNFGLGMPTNLNSPSMQSMAMPSTPFLDSLNSNNLGLQSMFPSSVAAPVQMPQAVASLPMMNTGDINVAQPGLADQIASFFHNTPLTTSLDTKTGMKTQGLFDMGLGTAQGLLGAYLGFQNLGIAKDTLAQNKRAFDLNFNAQRNLTNSRLADRQAARVASNPTAYTSVSDYMAKNGI